VAGRNAENSEVRKKLNKWLSAKGRLTPGYTLELFPYFHPHNHFANRSPRPRMTSPFGCVNKCVALLRILLAQTSLPKDEQEELLRQIRIHPEAEPDSLNNNPEDQSLHGEWREKAPGKQRVEDLLEGLNAIGGDTTSLGLLDQEIRRLLTIAMLARALAKYFLCSCLPLRGGAPRDH
jgi:hypothetical protein